VKPRLKYQQTAGTWIVVLAVFFALRMAFLFHEKHQIQQALHQTFKDSNRIQHLPKKTGFQELKSLAKAPLTYFDTLFIATPLPIAESAPQWVTHYAVNLNTCDSAELEALPKIGAKMASRIIKYRQRLGGFFSVNQLLEVKYIDSQILENPKISFSVDTLQVKRFDFATCTPSELYRHPYVGPSAAKILLAFRKAHPQIQHPWKDGNQIHGIPLEHARRISPYFR